VTRRLACRLRKIALRAFFPGTTSSSNRWCSNNQKKGLGMTTHLKLEELNNQGLKKVWSVAEFAKRYRLHREEEARLLKLLGPFASQQELLMNATRAPRFR